MLKRFGESKHKAKKEYRNEQESIGQQWNPAKAHGIFSHKTYQAYYQTAMEFAKWLRINHPEIKQIADIGKTVSYEYLQQRQRDGKSAFTISKDMSVFNKLFNHGLTKKEGQLAERSYKNVTRSRIRREHDRKYNPDNYREQILVAKATGCRRQSIHGGNFQVKPCSFWQDNNGRIYVSLIEKGGRFRNAPILKKYTNAINDLIRSIPVRSAEKNLGDEEQRFRALYQTPGEDFLFDRYTMKIDNHAFRAEYARARYEELIEQKVIEGYDISSEYRGKDPDCMQQLSLDLGHNRLSVAFEHYLR